VYVIFCIRGPENGYARLQNRRFDNTSNRVRKVHSSNRSGKQIRDSGVVLRSAIPRFRPSIRTAVRPDSIPGDGDHIVPHLPERINLYTELVDLTIPERAAGSSRSCDSSLGEIMSSRASIRVKPYYDRSHLAP